MKKYSYEEMKGDIKDFFEELDTFNLDRADSVKLDELKDTWAEFDYRFVTASYYGLEEELLTKVGEIFDLSNSVEDEDLKEQLLDYAYNYIAELKEVGIYDPSIEEGIDETLLEMGLFDVDGYFINKDQLENSNNQKK